ncbi:MAG: hypothetical protein NT169_20340 [Chloroflexi bacterium]|nr:hypothetical protein [Chloroflexota bacterium]
MKRIADCGLQIADWGVGLATQTSFDSIRRRLADGVEEPALSLPKGCGLNLIVG